MVFTRTEDKNGNAIYDVTPKTEEALIRGTPYISAEMMKGVCDGAQPEHRQDRGHRHAPAHGLGQPRQVR